MALFAKKLEYWASMTSYLALLAVAKKKGGAPISYIVYTYDGMEEDGSPWNMCTFFTIKEAMASFQDKSIRTPTTGWLHHVASGGGHECFPKGVWARVPTPRIGQRKRGRKPIMIGDHRRIYGLAKTRLHDLEAEYYALSGDIECMEHNLANGYEEDEVLLAEKIIKRNVLWDEIIEARNTATNILNEMRYIRSVKTGIPLPDSWCKELG